MLCSCFDLFCFKFICTLITWIAIHRIFIKSSDDTRQKWNEINLKNRIRIGEIIRSIQIVIQQVQGQKYHNYEERIQEQGGKWLGSAVTQKVWSLQCFTD